MSASGEFLFRASELTKSYGKAAVLRGLDLEFSAGEFVLLLGANGSGKSTLLRICAGLSRPDSGRIERHPGRVGYLGHALFLYANLTVRENLELSLKLHGMSTPCDTLLADWKLEDLGDRLLGELSRGQQQRVSIARSLLNNPNHVFMDEPTNALDEGSVSLVLETLKKKSREGDSFVVVATHDLSRLGSFADRAILLHDGHLLHDSNSKPDTADKDGRKDFVYAEYRRLNR